MQTEDFCRKKPPSIVRPFRGNGLNQFCRQVETILSTEIMQASLYPVIVIGVTVFVDWPLGP